MDTSKRVVELLASIDAVVRDLPQYAGNVALRSELAAKKSQVEALTAEARQQLAGQEHKKDEGPMFSPRPVELPSEERSKPKKP